MADTMFSNRKTILNSETDSLCAITRETKFSSMVDSLLQIESRRIEELSQ